MPIKHHQAALAGVLFQVLPVDPPDLPHAEVRRLVLERLTLTGEEQRINNYLGAWSCDVTSVTRCSRRATAV
jgi:hypothetical protein